MSSEELFSFMVQEPWRRKLDLTMTLRYACYDFKLYANLNNLVFTSIRTNQWYHAVHQGDVLVLQTLHVTDNVGFRVIAGDEGKSQRQKSV